MSGFAHYVGDKGHADAVQCMYLYDVLLIKPGENGIPSD